MAEHTTKIGCYGAAVAIAGLGLALAIAPRVAVAEELAAAAASDASAPLASEVQPGATGQGKHFATPTQADGAKQQAAVTASGQLLHEAGSTASNPTTPGVSEGGSAESGADEAANSGADGSGKADVSGETVSGPSGSNVQVLSTEPAPSDETPTEKAPADKMSTDKASSDKAPTDKVPAENAPTNATPTDTASTNKAPANLANGATAVDATEESKASDSATTAQPETVQKAGPTGWTADGSRYITGYDAQGNAQYLKSSWKVDDHDGAGLQRYWFDAEGNLVKGRLVDEKEGSGYWAYALDNGFILRGKLTLGDLIYMADNDGRLLSTGWTVTGDYTGGSLQRYYVEDDHAVHVGYSGNGWDHYSTTNGYVARGTYVSPEGKTYLADNDGKLAVSRWVVTDTLGKGGGLQRYWFHADGSMAANELVSPDEGAGWWAFARPDGAVVRGKYDNNKGRVYLADNDGKLASGSGWVVTGAYDGGTLQRYYMDANDHAARSGFFISSDGVHSFGQGGVGYVLRGKMTWGSLVLLANNDGGLESKEGWLVTGAYDGGTLQRYWLSAVEGFKGFFGAKTGLFKLDDGSTRYGIKGAGYLERNVHNWHGETYYSADNDGVLVVLDNDYARVVNAYVKFMVDMANDDSHGYDQTYRWGERGDYDCSSLVITALRAAGVNTYGASYTGNMRSQILRGHFVWITDLSQRRRGDILLNEGHHTAVYMGDEELVHASANEWGGATGGRPGDQTGKEIYIRSYYDRPWDGILRYIED